MKFRVGQVVRVVRGRSAGTVTTIVAEVEVCGNDSCSGGCPRLGGHPVVSGYAVDWPSQSGGLVGAPPHWFEPYHEPGDFQSLDELLRSVRGETVKERV